MIMAQKCEVGNTYRRLGAYCKTSDNDNMQWVYEIRAVSDHFQSKGVLAVSSDYRNKSRAAFVERANQMNVTLWGMETLWEQSR